MSSKLIGKYKVGIIITIILISSGLFAIPAIQNNINADDYISNFTQSNVAYGDGINVKVLFPENTHYKGNDIPFSLEISVIGSAIKLSYILINVSNTVRSATQRVVLNQTVGVGNHTIASQFTATFDMNGFLALNYGAYTLDAYELVYSQRHIEEKISESLEFDFDIIEWPVVNEFNAANWKFSDNIDISFNKGVPYELTITPKVSSGTAVLNVSLQTTSYVVLNYTVSTLSSSTIQLGFEGDISYDENGDQIFVGNLKDVQNFTIIYDFSLSESVTVQLLMLTQRIPIFVVNANNNWHGYATDGLYFERPDYYLKQVSFRFQATFNITMIEIIEVEFDMNATSSLYALISTANDAIGKSLKLVNNTWNIGAGPQPGNAGLDIELVYTNRTMDHLGIVIGSEGEAYNIAVNARGSNFEGNYRITSNFGDNLIQHELSHVFGAPDRWTDTDSASIMSKSKPDDAFFDIATFKFWLLRSNWLDEDITTMMNKAKLFMIT